MKKNKTTTDNTHDVHNAEQHCFGWNLDITIGRSMEVPER